MKKLLLFNQILLVIIISYSVCFSQTNIIQTSEKYPNALNSQQTTKSEFLSQKSSKAMWDVAINFPVLGYLEAGIETDGNYIYTSCWNANIFYRYNFAGVKLDSFSISGINGYIRDLAYDGTYFYGGTSLNVIYKMDFTNHTVVGTINCPSGTAVRSIAYDDNLGGFWVGNWATDIKCISPSGSVLATIPVANLELTGMYGSAYDKWTAGGPYLWIFDQVSTITGNVGAVFHQVKISTLSPTGLTHDCGSDISVSLDPAKINAGGAFSFIYNGNVILGGILQASIIFGYKLGTASSIGDISNNNLIEVYPNPCSSYVIIRAGTSPAPTFCLFDIAGRLVSENMLNQGDYNKISTAELKEGIYFYSVKNKDNSLLKKGMIIKE